MKLKDIKPGMIVAVRGNTSGRNANRMRRYRVDSIHKKTYGGGTKVRAFPQYEQDGEWVENTDHPRFIVPNLIAMAWEEWEPISKEQRAAAVKRDAEAKERLRLRTNELMRELGLEQLEQFKEFREFIEQWARRGPEAYAHLTLEQFKIIKELLQR